MAYLYQSSLGVIACLCEYCQVLLFLGLTPCGWIGVDDPDDPYNWSAPRKISTSAIVSLGQLVSFMSVSMMAPVLSRVARDLDINEFTTQITFSLFLLGVVFAPFPIASFSETYGRKPVWLFFNALYVLWNALCPVGHSLALMVVGRFLAGFGASVGITLTGPIMTDMYRKEDRGKSLALVTLISFLGPGLGPLLGSAITQKLEWPWLFWIMSILDAGISVAGLLLIKESYAPVLMARRHNAGSKSFRVAASKMAENLHRPLELLWRRPIIQVIALVWAVNFGVYCLLLSTFATLWISRYGQSEFISSLHYLSVSIGATIAAQGGGRFMDWTFAWQKARAPNVGTTPEYRVPCIVPGAIMTPIGLFWYGWAAEVGMHWAMVDVGVAIFVCGSFLSAQAMLAYLFDEFSHAASANAASRTLSYLLGFVFPIFGPRIFVRLGYGWGNSLLAFLLVAIGCPLPVLLWAWGPKLRALGR
ncbi:major facilitator superfamily transporter [Colletotrichum cereale]|nr:major facilitator superfamily transporter [Colletotrichum cereale]